MGKGVLQAVANINEKIADELIGMDEDQRFRLVQDIIDGNKGWQYEAAALPLGCQLK